MENQNRQIGNPRLTRQRGKRVVPQTIKDEFTREISFSDSRARFQDIPVRCNEILNNNKFIFSKIPNEVILVKFNKKIIFNK